MTKKDREIRTVCIKVTNEQLDALEDIITAKLTDEEFKKCQTLALQVWGQLVEQYDSQEPE